MLSGVIGAVMGRLAFGYRLRDRAAAFLRSVSPETVARGDPAPVFQSSDTHLGLRNAAALSTVVIVNALAGHAEASEEAYRAALESDPSMTDAATALRLHCTAAELRAGRGDLPAARQALEAAEATAAVLNPYLTPTAYLLLARGAVLELEGRMDEAFETYRRAAREAEAAGARYAATKATILAARLSPTPEADLPGLKLALKTLAQEGYRDLLIARPAVAEWLRQHAVQIDPTLRFPSATGRMVHDTKPAIGLLEAPPVELMLLGPFGLKHRGRIVAEHVWRTAKAKELLALLATSGKRSVARDALMAALWPESEPSAAVSKFHFTLHSLRREIASAGLDGLVSVERDAAGYALELPEGSVLDHEEFLGLVRQAREARFAGDAERHLTLLRKAIVMHRGSFLGGLSSAWIDELRERMDSTFLSAAKELAGAELEIGDPHAAIEHALKIVAADPFDEEAHRTVLRAYERSGAADLATRHFQSLERKLRRELGTRPEDATREIYQRMRKPGAVDAEAVPAD